MDADLVAAVVGVPGAGNVFLDLLRVSGVDRVHGGEVAIEDHAARILEGGGIGVTLGWEFAVGEVVGETTAVACPLLIEGSDGEQVRNVDLVDEFVGLADETRDEIEALRVDGRNFIHVDGARHAADEVIRMRVLAAEDRVDLDDFLLPLKRVEVMSDGDEIDFRRQLVGRVSPVAVGEDAETAGGEGLDLVLHAGEICRRILVPLGEGLRQLCGFLGIGLESVDDVDPVERVQVIEVDDVVLHVLGGHHDVADELSGGRDGDAESALNRTNAGEGVHGGADAADALGNGPGIARIAALENLLETANHGAGAESVSNDAIFHDCLNAQVAFNASNGIDDDACHNFSRLLLIFSVDFRDHAPLAYVGDHCVGGNTGHRGNSDDSPDGVGGAFNAEARE